MSIGDLKQDTFTKVGIYRKSFPMARYFFDIHINEDGIAGYYMWRRNDIRIPIYHNLKDYLARRSRDNKSRDEVVDDDDRNFFIPFDEIQGVVTHREHKEIQILSSQEIMNILFRPFEDYDRFVEILKENVSKQMFSRDKIEVPDTVNVS